jgi:GT2 family glycosyltransferase
MNTPTSPLVSILIVTWNRRKDLSRSIESALAQSYPNIEVVVVDNASTDGTAQMVARDFAQVRLVRSATNLGCPCGRNLGFAHCHGKYIYMLDDDGWLSEDAIEVSVRRAESDESLAVVMSRIHQFQHGQTVLRRPEGLEAPVYLGTFSGGCSLVRRLALEATGYFPNDFSRQAEEFDLMLRLADLGYWCQLEPASVMFHAPNPVGRSNRVTIFYNLRNGNKTAVRLLPWPWCVLKPAGNIIHALGQAVRHGWRSLPFQVFAALARDVMALPRSRYRRVRPSTYRLVRHLLWNPSVTRPSAQAVARTSGANPSTRAMTAAASRG